MAIRELSLEEILKAMAEFALKNIHEVSSSQLKMHVQVSTATLKRYLEKLVNAGHLIRTGNARSTRYRLTQTPALHLPASTTSFRLSKQSQELLVALQKPIAARKPVTYQRKFVDNYTPNESSLLPPDVAESLFNEGRIRGQQPAGTYARKVLEQLLIDLSWSSSRLEGNRYTLLATEELFKRGSESGDPDATMLLNHKRAIEFLVDAVPEYGLTIPTVRNLHSLLMQDLLDDARGLGEIRTKIVNIADSVYVPTQIPTLLRDMLELIIKRAILIKNPVEAAFFLWVNIAYLQPFEDGNKRTSRLAANIPLMINNCAPLSFMDISAQDYAYAMMGIYERLNVGLAVDLFAWTYRRSTEKYSVVKESMGMPDAFRIKYRELLTAAIQKIVVDGSSETKAVNNLDLLKVDHARFKSMLQQELSGLNVNNCARHRIGMKTMAEWIKKAKNK